MMNQLVEPSNEEKDSFKKAMVITTIIKVGYKLQALKIKSTR